MTRAQVPHRQRDGFTDHLRALHSALMTGVRYALARGLQEQDAVAKSAVDYVQTSAPDALSWSLSASLAPQGTNGVPTLAIAL